MRIRRMYQDTAEFLEDLGYRREQPPGGAVWIPPIPQLRVSSVQPRCAVRAVRRRR